MRKRLLTALFATGMLGAFSLPAQVVLTVDDNNDMLQSINLQTLAFTNIGTLSVSYSFGDLAWDPATQTLYMIDGRGAGGLYKVDVTTAQATLIGLHGITDLFALTYDTANNTLYAGSFATPFVLYTLNVSTGAATAVGNTGVAIGDLAYDSSRNLLIAINDGTGKLYQIDTATGAATLLASPGYTNNSGLTYDPVNDRYLDIDHSGFFYSYDITNGYARTTLLSGLSSHDGLVYLASVPEPSTWLLLGAGAALVWWRRRDRRHARTG